MKKVLNFFVLLIFTTAKFSEGRTGSFWHITDLHLDPNYNSTYGDVDHMCWMIPKAANLIGRPGKFGDRECDSPKELILSALLTMSEIDDSPDFIIWTGDDTTHVKDIFFSEEKVVEVISNLTDMIQDVFPKTLVLPALGNHDYFPKNQMPPGPNVILQGLADVWKPWLTKADAYDQFNQDGQYTYEMPNSKITLLVLNTNFWFKINGATVDDPDASDPAGLFAKMEDSLVGAKKLGRMVYIVGHIPPGKFERFYRDATGVHDLQPRYNRKYIEIINRFHGVIGGQFFAHQHTSSFRVFLSPEDQSPISFLFTAPPVSPLKHFYGVGAAHPSVRRVIFDTETAEIMEMGAYYLNLEEANQKEFATWQFEGNLTSTLQLKKIDATSLYEAALKIKDGSNAVYEGYYASNTVQWDTDASSCNATCRMAHFCAITQLDFNSYFECRNGPAGGPAYEPILASSAQLCIFGWFYAFAFIFLVFCC